MIYRKLGSSDIDASVVALGAWAIGGWMWGGTEEDDAVKTIHTALDHGINFIDTAPIYGYGRSETIVGRAVKTSRDKVILATKCGLVWDRQQGEFFFYGDEKGRADGSRQTHKKVYKYLQPQSIAAEIERSLARLDTDYIDLYQTHWQDSTTPIEETMAVLLKLKDQGKIRAIGVSNVNLDQLRSYGQIDSDQERYNMLDRDIEQNGILAHCRENNIAVLAYCPIGQGLLTGKMSPDRKFNPGDLRNNNPRFSRENRRRVNDMLRKLLPIAQNYNAAIAQLVIAWTFSQPGLTHVLCGARNPEQAIENARAVDINLSPEDIKTIDRIIQQLRLE